MPINPKFAILVRPLHHVFILDGKSCRINSFSNENRVNFYQGYRFDFQEDSEFEFWSKLYARYGEQLWLALDHSGLQGAALAFKARAFLQEGEGWVKSQQLLVKEEAVAMYYELVDYLGYAVRSKSVKAKSGVNDPYSKLRIASILQHRDFGHKLALTVYMLPDPIDENAWSVKAYGKPKTIEEFSHLRAQLQESVATLLARNGLKQSNLDFGVELS